MPVGTVVALGTTVAVSVMQNQILFVLGDVVLSSRLIDGQFPNYCQLLRETFEQVRG